MNSTDKLANNGRRMVATCALAATGVGLAYMAAGNAPTRYLAMNGAALAIGFAIAAIGARLRAPLGAGAACLMLALALLLSWAAGISVAGATRWIALGNVIVQPSLILMPVMALCFARGRDTIGVAGIGVAALVLALQPDRAMAGALAAGMAALALVQPGRNVLIALGAAVAGFAAAMLRPDTQGAMPFVDRIFYTSFDVHPLAGLAVVAGSAILLVPAALGLWRDPVHRPVHAVFGATWLAAIAAAALGNYPTPVVGYGGSAIIGYLLCQLAMPGAASLAANRTLSPAAPAEPDIGRDSLRRV